ncbi:MAG: PTS sugar transporter subunit IIA [Leptotrichiaceae bacterium]|jgi:PTS system nitrogen regulatory IIA component
MKITDFLTKDRIVFDLESKSKSNILREMAELFEDGTIIEGKEGLFYNDLKEREDTTSTGMQDGLAVPHAKSAAISKLAIALAITKNGVDFNSMDGEPSRVFFMIAAPEDTKREHLNLLSLISKFSYEDELMEELLTTNDKDRVIEMLSTIE